MNTGNKRIIGLTIASLLCIAMVSAGVWAYFSDPEPASTNITAGTLDLKTNDVDGVTQTLNAPSLKPNNSHGPKTITLKNTGSIDGATLDIVFAYAESDGSPNPVNMSALDTAKIIQVTTLTYNGFNLLPTAGDKNSNGYTDVDDLKLTTFSGLSGLNAGQSKDFVITIMMRDGIDNNFQGDGIDTTMTFRLNQ